ncbi:phosphotransferase family protein [Chengkuizengella sediminis]|uniref:phosphotransferase family protein n=1 Tax=Chengkuizengella sediminis TaxID=1885917 RepID=UPI00138A1BFD|nr:aminoglycoside phosphotransferase family protein [Chengkuizengella sediminis]NDI33266.1 aminoglycoside phosphotransferase family protein [Chengkuizengella sediminis]
MYNDYIDRIKQVYPEILIKDIEPNVIGQNNDVLIINKSLVFRFPKYKLGITKLKEETAILKSINNSLTTQIPNPIYQSFEQMEVGQVFTGYKLIQGSPFWREEFEKIKDKDLVKKLALQLVTFLIELHSIPIEQIERVLNKKKKNDVTSDVKVLFNKIENKLYSFMSKDAKEKVSHMFESILNNERNLDIKQRLTHGDFGASNILWKSNSSEISGVIDFGGIEIGDPAYDFSGILSSYGEDFFNLCINLYPNGSEISERVKFYKSTFALQEALHGIENNDHQAFVIGIKEYR